MTYQLPKAEDKAAYVEQGFDEIAGKYDRFNDLITFGLHRYWKRFVARQTGLRPGVPGLVLRNRGHRPRRAADASGS